VNGNRLLRAKSSIRLGGGARANDVQAEALDRLERFSSGDERGQDEVTQRPVVEQQVAHRATIDGDVAQRLGDNRGDEDRLSREQVELTEEPRRAVPDDLAARRVEDRDLAFDDRDERVDLVADAVEHIADLSRALLAQPGECLELLVREHRAVGRVHASEATRRAITRQKQRHRANRERIDNPVTSRRRRVGDDPA
jgi:hypothetical protein